MDISIRDCIRREVSYSGPLCPPWLMQSLPVCLSALVLSCLSVDFYRIPQHYFGGRGVAAVTPGTDQTLCTSSGTSGGTSGGCRNNLSCFTLIWTNTYILLPEPWLEVLCRGYSVWAATGSQRSLRLMLYYLLSGQAYNRRGMVQSQSHFSHTFMKEKLVWPRVRRVRAHYPTVS